MRPRLVFLLLLIVGAATAVVLLRRDGDADYYTGFVEGEERIVRSEVTGKILEVRAAEGETVPPNAVVAVLDSRDVVSRLRAQREEVSVLEARIEAQTERVKLRESTWRREVAARAAEVGRAAAGAELADRNLSRESELVETGASTAQQLDEARTRQQEASATLRHAHAMLARSRAEKGSVTVARRELDTLRRERGLAVARLAELEVQRSKHEIRSPAVATIVQTRFAWPGELAQPGTPILAMLDPEDKYVQVYLPVEDLDRVRVGDRVEIETDAAPGKRIPGEISFIADRASFTPEKIETRSDRLGQVYRTKVRILEDAALLKAGAEGNVYLTTEAQPAKTARDGGP